MASNALSYDLIDYISVLPRLKFDHTNTARMSVGVLRVTACAPVRCVRGREVAWNCEDCLRRGAAGQLQRECSVASFQLTRPIILTATCVSVLMSGSYYTHAAGRNVANLVPWKPNNDHRKASARTGRLGRAQTELAHIQSSGDIGELDGFRAIVTHRLNVLRHGRIHVSCVIRRIASII